MEHKLPSENPSKNAIEGTEAADHTISFDGNNKFNNHSLDFYAVTLSDKTLVPDIKYNSNGHPLVMFLMITEH